MVDRWWVQGNCLEVEGDNGHLLTVKERMEIFFPDNERVDSARAKAICHGCPVRRDCLDEAIAEMRYRDSPQGIRGGMTGEERFVEKYNRMNRNHNRRKKENA